jgi:hypothetical protein
MIKYPYLTINYSIVHSHGLLHFLQLKHEIKESYLYN